MFLKQDSHIAVLKIEILFTTIFHLLTACSTVQPTVGGIGTAFAVDVHQWVNNLYNIDEGKDITISLLYAVLCTVLKVSHPTTCTHPTVRTPLTFLGIAKLVYCTPLLSHCYLPT